MQYCQQLDRQDGQSPTNNSHKAILLKEKFQKHREIIRNQRQFGGLPQVTQTNFASQNKPQLFQTRDYNSAARYTELTTTSTYFKKRHKSVGYPSQNSNLIRTQNLWAQVPKFENNFEAGFYSPKIDQQIAKKLDMDSVLEVSPQIQNESTLPYLQSDKRIGESNFKTVKNNTTKMNKNFMQIQEFDHSGYLMDNQFQLLTQPQTHMSLPNRFKQKRKTLSQFQQSGHTGNTTVRNSRQHNEFQLSNMNDSNRLPMNQQLNQTVRMGSENQTKYTHIYSFLQTAFQREHLRNTQSQINNSLAIKTYESEKEKNQQKEIIIESMSFDTATEDKNDLKIQVEECENEIKELKENKTQSLRIGERVQKKTSSMSFNQKKKLMNQKQNKRQILTDDSPITGNPHDLASGLANNLAQIDFSGGNPLGDLLSLQASKICEIKIYHVEKNMAIDSEINQAIQKSNELVKIANLSISYQNSRSDFSLCNKELALVKSCGIEPPRVAYENDQYFRTKEFQVTLKDKSLKMLVNSLQKAQNLPITPESNKKFNQFNNLSQSPNLPSNVVLENGVKGDQIQQKSNHSNHSVSEQFHQFMKGSDQFQQQNQNRKEVPIYKYCVGKANNAALIKQTMKLRWWFSPLEIEEFEKSQFIWTPWYRHKYSQELLRTKNNPLIYNRMEKNYLLSNKKSLLYVLQEFYKVQGKCVFENKVFPQTFHLINGIDDFKYPLIEKEFEKNPESIWIIKPGENSNRGVGIQVAQGLKEVEMKIKLARDNFPGENQTIIVQKYIEKPLLVYRRKFDIRVFGLLTCVDGFHRGYFYQEGYLRTSSKEYNLSALSNKYVHLTNDAIQQKGSDFGKYESGNKLSFSDFQKYLKVTEDLKDQYKGENGRVDFYKQILPQIRHLVAESFRSVSHQKIDPQRKSFSFEIFGYDFMIDEDFTVYLIEANTNPCLGTNSAILSRIIPVMVDSSFTLSIDPILAPPLLNFKRSNDPAHENKYIQIFDESIEGQNISDLYDSTLE